jgi:hypothetical protein
MRKKLKNTCKREKIIKRGITSMSSHTHTHSQRSFIANDIILIQFSVFFAGMRENMKKTSW